MSYYAINAFFILYFRFHLFINTLLLTIVRSSVFIFSDGMSSCIIPEFIVLQD